MRVTTKEVQPACNMQKFVPISKSWRIRLNLVQCYLRITAMVCTQEIDKEINELKLSVNTRGRAVAIEFLSAFA